MDLQGTVSKCVNVGAAESLVGQPLPCLCFCQGFSLFLGHDASRLCNGLVFRVGFRVAPSLGAFLWRGFNPVLRRSGVLLQEHHSPKQYQRTQHLGQPLNRDYTSMLQIVELSEKTSAL